MTAARRNVQFGGLDEVMPEVERLMAGRHETVGNWSLAQICRHLATVMRRVVDLPASTPHDPSQWFDEGRKRAIFDSGTIPEGLPTPGDLVPASNLDAREEAEGLRAAIAHYQASRGPVIAHRFFGFLSREEWDRLQCIHCGHHLGFTVPKPD